MQTFSDAAKMLASQTILSSKTQISEQVTLLADAETAFITMIKFLNTLLEYCQNESSDLILTREGPNCSLHFPSGSKYLFPVTELAGSISDVSLHLFKEKLIEDIEHNLKIYKRLLQILKDNKPFAADIVYKCLHEYLKTKQGIFKELIPLDEPDEWNEIGFMQRQCKRLKGFLSAEYKVFSENASYEKVEEKSYTKKMKKNKNIKRNKIPGRMKSLLKVEFHDNLLIEFRKDPQLQQLRSLCLLDYNFLVAEHNSLSTEFDAIYEEYEDKIKGINNFFDFFELARLSFQKRIEFMSKQQKFYDFFCKTVQSHKNITKLEQAFCSENARVADLAEKMQILMNENHKTIHAIKRLGKTETPTTAAGASAGEKESFALVTEAPVSAASAEPKHTQDEQNICDCDIYQGWINIFTTLKELRNFNNELISKATKLNDKRTSAGLCKNPTLDKELEEVFISYGQFTRKVEELSEVLDKYSAELQSVKDRTKAAHKAKKMAELDQKIRLENEQFTKALTQYKEESQHRLEQHQKSVAQAAEDKRCEARKREVMASINKDAMMRERKIHQEALEAKRKAIFAHFEKGNLLYVESIVDQVFTMPTPHFRVEFSSIKKLAIALGGEITQPSKGSSHHGFKLQVFKLLGNQVLFGMFSDLDKAPAETAAETKLETLACTVVKSHKPSAPRGMLSRYDVKDLKQLLEECGISPTTIRKAKELRQKEDLQTDTSVIRNARTSDKKNWQGKGHARFL